MKIGLNVYDYMKKVITFMTPAVHVTAYKRSFQC